MTGNILILQSGISSVVGNATLYGLLTEALNYEDVEEIYGVFNGFEGLQKENFIDLAALPQQSAKALLYTAGFALKTESSNFYQNECDFNKMVQNLKDRDIHYIACICDQNALKYAQELSQAAESIDYNLNVLAIPQSNTNELPITDHSLGYGSYLKYVANYLRELEQNVRTSSSRLGICEIIAGNNGWVTAGTALNINNGKNKQSNDNPFIVALPEQPLNEQQLADLVTEKMNTYGYACVVVNHTLFNQDGETIDLNAFGGSSAYYLSEIIYNKLNIESQIYTCDMKTQVLSHFISEQDQKEAVACGREAIKALLQDQESNKAIVVLRKDSEHYDFEVKVIDWNEVIDGTKFLPSDWIQDNMWINYSFTKYAQPLIQGEVPVHFEKGLAQLAHL